MTLRLYLDTGDLAVIKKYAADESVAGITTNPSLLRASGVTDYLSFAQSVLNIVRDKPVSLEVLADDLEGMERQARKLAGLAENVYVKLPITTTQGEYTSQVIAALPDVKWNITAITTIKQMVVAHASLTTQDAILSVFAGRIADTGRDPIPLLMAGMIEIKPYRKPNHLNLWASAREALNVRHAEQAGMDIITLSPALLDKHAAFGKDLAQVSLETVAQFSRDSQGLSL